MSENIAWVVAEHDGSYIRPVTYEVIAFAKKVCDAVGCEVAVVVPGNPVRRLAEAVARGTGCDVVGIDSQTAAIYNAETYRQLLKKFFEDKNPRFVFIPHTTTGWDFSPALSVDMGASNITAVSGFKFEQGPVFTRQICNGKIYEDVKPFPDRPAVITVMPGIEQPLPEVDEAGSVEIIDMETPPLRSKTVRHVEAPPTTVNLKEAEVIVSAGRGIGDPEHLDIISELAGLFESGAVGASRPVCDSGWLDFHSQVGMTGQTVSPKLYIACGISGAIQHTMGMKNSKLIISVNKDKNALFTRTAHYCVATDLHKFIPALIKKVREYKK